MYNVYPSPAFRFFAGLMDTLKQGSVICGRIAIHTIRTPALAVRKYTLSRNPTETAIICIRGIWLFALNRLWRGGSLTNMNSNRIVKEATRMGRKGMALLVVFLVLFGAVAAGCLGGGGSEESPSETYQENTNEGGGSPSSSPSAGEETSTATWQTPWDAYNPVQINGQSYYITYIKYTFTVKGSGEEKRSYEVIKQRGYVKAHIYADDNGNRKDLGEYTLFAYYGKITPLNDPDMNGPLEYLILIKERTKDTDAYFLTPFPDFSAMMSGRTAVIEASYGGNYFYWSNPAAIGEYSELPYQEGDFNAIMSGIPAATVQAWGIMVTSGVWSGLEEHDLSKPDEYSFSFMGIGYSYKINPDGTVSFGGKKFKVSNVEWSWTIGGTKGQGKGKIAPELPIPVEVEGTFSQMGEGSYYSKIKLIDIELSEKFKGISVEIQKPTNPGESQASETETGTSTSTQSPGQGSESGSGSISSNWNLAWDASEPITIEGRSYIVREVTYESEYHLSSGPQAQMTIKKGYKEGKLNGEDVYILYAIVDFNGERYNYTLYVSPDELSEYTSGALWIPSVGEMMSIGSELKVEVTGPNCHYSMDENYNMEGDPNCGIIDEGFQMYNTIWASGGFYGGVYCDVVCYVTLTNNGEGYMVEPAGEVELAGMDFDVYRITWSGTVQYSDVQANGETIVAPELPFPVEVTASLATPGGGGIYVHTKLVDIKLEETGH